MPFFKPIPYIDLGIGRTNETGAVCWAHTYMGDLVGHRIARKPLPLRIRI